MLLIIIGVVFLYFGAEGLVRGSASLATRMGVSPLVAGLTIVAFGTSAPELSVSLSSALGGHADIALGNVIGSNIFNIMAVIGITAIITPIGVSEATIYKDLWWVVGIAVALFPIMIIGKKIGRFKGALLLSTYIIYITLAVVYLDPVLPG